MSSPGLRIIWPYFDYLDSFICHSSRGDKASVLSGNEPWRGGRWGLCVSAVERSRRGQMAPMRESRSI